MKYSKTAKVQKCFISVLLAVSMVLSAQLTIWGGTAWADELPCRSYKVGYGTIKRLRGPEVVLSGEAFGNDISEVSFYYDALMQLPVKEGEYVKYYYQAERYFTNLQVFYMTNQVTRQPNEVPVEEKISFLQAVGIAKGDESGNLNLEKEVTRAEYIAMLFRQVERSYHMGEPENPFLDCKGHWAEQDICYAYSCGYIKGVSQFEFAPDTPVSYGEMIMIACRFAKLPYRSDFKAEEYISLARREGLISVDDPTENTRKDAFNRIFNLCPHEPKVNQEPELEQGGVGAKPVIYLYPQQEQRVQVKLDLDGEFTFTYPAYGQGWDVIAKPDGTILSGGKEYSYLFWEGGMPQFQTDFSEGFVVKREDTVAFLQDILPKMGLTPKEYNEFIVYWAPILEQNAYNKIYFAGGEYEQAARLSVSPPPDSVLRVFMVYEEADADTVLPPQEIKPFERKGFTVVEWGGYRR